MDFNELDKTIKELDNCVATSIAEDITPAEPEKEEGDKFLGKSMKNVTQKKYPNGKGTNHSEKTTTGALQT
jgi:hypothetical protein